MFSASNLNFYTVANQARSSVDSSYPVRFTKLVLAVCALASLYFIRSNPLYTGAALVITAVGAYCLSSQIEKAKNRAMYRAACDCLNNMREIYDIHQLQSDLKEVFKCDFSLAQILQQTQQLETFKLPGTTSMDAATWALIEPNLPESLTCFQAEIADENTLTKMSFENFPNLKELIIKGNQTLAHLRISDCNQLKKFWVFGSPNLQIQGLHTLSNLTSLSFGDLNNPDQLDLTSLQSLKNLSLICCNTASCDVSNLSQLERVTIDDCPNLTLINLTGALNLKKLIVKDSPNINESCFQSLPENCKLKITPPVAS